MFAEKEHKPQQNSTSNNWPSSPVQTKLEIGAKDDPQEKEADEVAEKVVSGSAMNATGSGDGNIRRTEEDEEKKVMTMKEEGVTPKLRMKEEVYRKVHKMHSEEKQPVMTMKDESAAWKKRDQERDEALQLKPETSVMMEADPGGGGGGTATPAFQQQLNSSKGQGNPLPEHIQQDFGSKMGTDLSDVRVHTDGSAHEMSAGINAKAFTHGNDIYFKQGNYNPTSEEGKKLLAHETHHTVQQGGVRRKVQRAWYDDLYDATIGSTVESVTDLYHYATDSEEEFNKYTQGKLLKQLNYWNSNPAPTLGFKVAYYGTMAVAGAMFPFSIAVFPSMDTLWDLVVRGKQGYYHYLYHLDPNVKETGQAGSMITATKTGAGSLAKMSAVAKSGTAAKAGNSKPSGGSVKTAASPASKSTSVTKEQTPASVQNLMGNSADNKVKQKKLKGGYAKVIDHQMKNLIDPMFTWGEVKGLFKGIGGWFTDIWDAIVWLVEGIGSVIGGTVDWISSGETPQWLKSLKAGASKAFNFIWNNGKEMVKGFAKALSDPNGGIKKWIGDLKSDIMDGAGDAAYEKGRSAANTQVEIMSMSAEAQGEKVGYVIGYLIPEILLMVFSGSLGNWIKGGLEALSKFSLVMKGIRIWEKIVSAGRWMMESIGKLWKVIKTFFSSTFGKAFDDIMEFFGGLVKHGDDMAKAEKNALKGEKGLAEGTDHLDDGKKGVKEEPDPHKDPEVDQNGKPKDGPESKKRPKDRDGRDRERNIAWAAAIKEVVSSNAENEFISEFHADLKQIKLKHPIVKWFVYTPGPNDGELIFMVASKKRLVGWKHWPKQIHHFATNKHKIYGAKMDRIAKKYNLDLDGDWNKELMHHLGRHPHDYHEFVYENMLRASKEAGQDLKKFLRLYNKYVKKPVLANPYLLRKIGWI